MPSTATTPSKAGITTSSTGERHIPASTRPDGSVRKEIRVRPGYRPPEDVEVYKNRTAEAFRTRGQGGVPGAQFVDDKYTQSNANKSKKKRVPKPVESQNGSTNLSTQQDDARSPNLSSEKPDSVPSAEPEPFDPEVEKEKQARKLSKKLRQARDLQQKKENGDALLPEQFEKVIRMNELIRQLDALGFDAEGEKKL